MRKLLPIAALLGLAIALFVSAQQVTPPSGGGGGGPTGNAGGVLSGTYPNPGLANSVALPGSPTTATTAYTANGTGLATTNFVRTLLAASNPATSVAAATVTVLPDTPTYSNGSSGVGATLTAGSHAALVIDGYTVLLNDRVLVNNQASAFQNGVYSETTLGSGSAAYVLTRASDFNSVSAINSAGVIPVINGSANANTYWSLAAAIAAIGTPNAINYNQAPNQSPAAPPHSITFALTPTATGDQKIYPSFHYACTLQSYDITADQSGSISVDIWQANAAIPTSGNKISASAPVALSSAQLAQGGSVSTWTTAVAANAVFAANVSSYSTLTHVTITLWCQ